MLFYLGKSPFFASFLGAARNEESPHVDNVKSWSFLVLLMGVTHTKCEGTKKYYKSQ